MDLKDLISQIGSTVLEGEGSLVNILKALQKVIEDGTLISSEKKIVTPSQGGSDPYDKYDQYKNPIFSKRERCEMAFEVFKLLLVQNPQLTRVQKAEETLYDDEAIFTEWEAGIDDLVRQARLATTMFYAQVDDWFE